MDPWVILLLLALIAVLYVLLPVASAMASRYRTPKLVRCPLAGKDAAIRVGRAGMAEALGCRSLRRVEACVLWPDRQTCAELCLELPDTAMRETATPA